MQFINILSMITNKSYKNNIDYCINFMKLKIESINMLKNNLRILSMKELKNTKLNKNQTLLKDDSPRKNINNQDNFTKWIELALTLANKNIRFPQEAYLLMALELCNKEYNNAPIGYKQFLYDTVEEYLFKDISFNLSGSILQTIIERLDKSFINEDRLKLIKDKLKNLKLIEIDEISSDYVLLSLEGLPKVEVTKYFKGLENYYFLPNYNINVVDLNSGTLIKKIVKEESDLTESNDYYLLNAYIRKNYQLDLNNQYMRILSYVVSDQLAAMNLIMANPELLNYFVKFHKIYNAKNTKLLDEFMMKKNIDRLLKDLVEEPTKSNFIEMLYKCKTVDDIFSFIKIAPNIVKDFDVDCYIEAIKECRKRSDYDIRIALFCEKLLKDNTIALDDIVYFLKEIYKQNIFTGNSKRMLEYIEDAYGYDLEIELILLNIKSKEGNFDSDFIDKFIHIYSSTENKKDFDNIINKLISSNMNIFRQDLIEPIYYFYKRNNDLNALRLLVKNAKAFNMLSLRNILEVQDLIRLFQFYETHNISFKEIIDISMFYLENDSICNYIVKLVEGVYRSNNENNIKIMNTKYIHIIEAIYKKSEIISNEFMKLIAEGTDLPAEFRAKYFKLCTSDKNLFV